MLLTIREMAKSGRKEALKKGIVLAFALWILELKHQEIFCTVYNYYTELIKDG